MILRVRRIRRRTDRIEDWTAWLLCAAGLLVILSGFGYGVGVYDRLAERGRVEAVDRTLTSATLLETASTAVSMYATASSVGAVAIWRDGSGAERTGLVTVPQGLAKGSRIAIWIDRTGAALPAPTSAQDATAVAAIGAGIVIATGLSILVGAWRIVRRVTYAYNCASWEREWREVAPIWSRGEGMR